MNDKDREIEKLIGDYKPAEDRPGALPLRDILSVYTIRGLAKLIVAALPDRVAGRFTEEGFRAWLSKERPELTKPSVETWTKLAAEYASTLETEPMSVEEIDDALHAFKGLYAAIGSSEIRNLARHLQPLTVRQVAPVPAGTILNPVVAPSVTASTSMPVEGGLTREEWLRYINDSDPTMTKLWDRIQSDRATLENKIDQEKAVSKQLNKLCFEIGDHLKRARATITDLTKQMEGAVHLGDEIEYQFRSGGGWSGGIIAILSSGRAYTQNDVNIRRPTPVPLTAEEKAEAVMRAWGYYPDSDVGRSVGESALLRKMLESGKTIDELYREAGLTKERE